MRKLLLALGTISLILPGLNADVLVLKNGKRMVIKGAYETKGKFIVCTSESGELIQLPLSILDVEQSKVATDEAAAVAAAKAEEEAKPKPKKEVKSLAETLTAGAKPQTKTERTVYFSNDGLDNYTQSHEPAVYDSVGAGEAQSAAPATSSAAAATSELGQIEPIVPEPGLVEPNPEVKMVDVNSLSDPDAMNQQRKATQTAHNEAKKDFKKVDAEIKQLEEARQNAEAASAFGDENDQEFVQSAIEKTDELLKEKRKERDEKAKNLQSVEKDAKSKGVRLKSPKEEKLAPRTKKSDDSEEGDFDDSDGSDDVEDDEDDRDENGKSKPIE